MAKNQTTLIVGATGQLGSLIANELAEKDTQIRALIRNVATTDAQQRAGIDRLSKLGAEIVEGDISKNLGLDRAVAGVDIVVSTLPFRAVRMSSLMDKDTCLRQLRKPESLVSSHPTFQGSYRTSSPASITFTIYVSALVKFCGIAAFPGHQSSLAHSCLLTSVPSSVCSIWKKGRWNDGALVTSRSISSIFQMPLATRLRQHSIQTLPTTTFGL